MHHSIFVGSVMMRADKKQKKLTSLLFFLRKRQQPPSINRNKTKNTPKPLQNVSFPLSSTYPSPHLSIVYLCLSANTKRAKTSKLPLQQKVLLNSKDQPTNPPSGWHLRSGATIQCAQQHPKTTRSGAMEELREKWRKKNKTHLTFRTEMQET